MSGEEPEEPIAAGLNAAENASSDAVEEERRQEEEADEKRRRETLEDLRAAMSDAEDTCVFLVDDLLAAIFQEMQVRSENASLFAKSARQMCAQAFEGVAMSASEPSASLDRIAGIGKREFKGRQQVLKPKNHWAPAPQCPSSASLDALPPPLVFLRRLLKFLETHADRTDLELLRFPMSAAVESSPAKLKLLGVGQGEWCIPADQVAAFLRGLLSKGLVSAVPSTVTFVMAANHDSLEKKTHSHARVALTHLQQLVQKALLVAEEEEERSAERRRQAQQPALSSDKAPKTDIEAKPASWSRIFQTEVPQSKLKFPGPLNGDVEAQPGEGPEQDLLSSYLAEIPPRAVAMDRRAPNQVGKKAALSAANPSQRAISRKILLLMAPPPRNGSRWTTVRHKVIVPSSAEAQADGVTTITAEADMELHLAGDRPHPRAVGLSVQATASESIAENEETLDTAALTNIFSLGTPRQLSAHELARRNDLLAQLEREAGRAQRRATTSVIASMSLGGAPGRRESDEAVCISQAEHQQFQAYVAANSTVMNGVETGGWSPTRPERSDQPAAPRTHGRGGSLRSKFELERDTLPFSVFDGNAHAREEQERLSAAMCSPIKRPRASIVPSPPPESPGRPIQTASTMAHLPQLDSSRLAVGVNAVVRGVEKRGPRRNPSRKSRLELHNYSAAFDGVEEHDTEVKSGAQVPFSPVRTSQLGQQESARDVRLPLIPAVSPIKASAHRKHVAFKLQTDATIDRASASISPKAHVRQRPSAKAKQAVWDTKTRSPPRARNHHFASGRHFRKVNRYDEEDGESSSARREKQQEQANIFRQPMAPRRNVSPTASEDED